MKKLLGILVLGLMVSGCNNNDSKLLENCTDQNFFKNGYRFEDDPLNIRAKSVSTKLKNEIYDSMWNDCEVELKTYPKKFKVKYKYK